ncbi:hypothetical protein ACVINW_004026 [Bradyrhizobium sp. USDA 4461]
MNFLLLDLLVSQTKDEIDECVDGVIVLFAAKAE